MESRPNTNHSHQNQNDSSAQGEEATESLHVVRRSRLFYWNWCRLRPLLKRLLPSQAHRMVRLTRGRFQPTAKQHAPIPLTIPEHYRDISLPPLESPPVVSIVTPSLNQGKFLERTITSVIEQNYPKLEYIIQDGGSTDGTDQILEKYRPQFTYVESREDKGQAHAINLGFRHATGEIMAWLNADDVFLPGAIAYVVNFFVHHPEVDVVYGYRIGINEQDNEVGRWILPPSAEACLPWANYVPQETLFWRRRLWERVGGYVDESYQFALDWDLLLRFYTAGATFACLPRFLGAFRVHQGQKTVAWEERGKQETKRLHEEYHGRPVAWLEVRQHVKKYLLRCAWHYLLYYLGLIHY